MTASIEKQLTSIGILANQLDASIREIERAADTLRLRPSQVVDGVVYYNGRQVVRISDKLNQKGK